MNTSTLRVAALTLAMGLSGAAHAALQGRNMDDDDATFEAYYDTVLDITWLADANYAKTSGYDTDGRMTWAAANTWAANLSFTNQLTYQIYADWRLPITLQPDASCSAQSGGNFYGYGCTGSEIGHLFYAELGGTATQSILTSTDPDVVKFTNLQDNIYWSATGNALDGGLAWGFVFYDGFQGLASKGSGLYALAVSPGDIAAVPEADMWAMLLAGLGLVGAAARRRG